MSQMGGDGILQLTRFAPSLVLPLKPPSSPLPPMQLLTNYLDEYNMEHKAPLQLVFFMDAIKYIGRIARILRQPRGSAMLVGVGGSGKQSLTRFAAFISDTQCMTIELVRNYGLNEFREDIKKMFK